jgi:hypothetical protein
MKAKCINSSGIELSKQCHDLGFTPDSKFDIRLDSEYIIYGICIWRQVILYLLEDDTFSPNWYPSGLFYLILNQVPTNWQFATYEGDEYSVKAVLGYPDLINESHYTGLIERDEKALKIFQEMKRFKLN